MKKFLCWVLSAGLLFPPALVSSAWAQDEPCHMSSMLRSCHEDWHRAGCVRSLFSYFAKNKNGKFPKDSIGVFTLCSEKLNPADENDRKSLMELYLGYCSKGINLKEYLRIFDAREDRTKISGRTLGCSGDGRLLLHFMPKN